MAEKGLGYTTRGGALKAQRLLFPVAALLLAVIATLLLSEIVVRTAKLFVCTEQDFLFFQRNPHYGWGHNPERRGWSQSCRGRETDFRAYVEFNSNGLRDTEHRYDRPSGGFRVLVLGDSVTEGAQVSLDETFVQLLEERLDRSERPVEVLNAGVAGWGTDNELLFFEAEGERYRSDLVVLVLNLQNDIVDNHPELYLRAHALAEHQAEAKALARLTEDGSLTFDYSWLRESLASDAAAVEQPSFWEWMQGHFYALRLIVRRFRPVQKVGGAAEDVRLPDLH